jgi:hypothetical protein
MTYHEESMISACANDPHFDPVLGIPLNGRGLNIEMKRPKVVTHTSISVENIDIVTGVQIIDGTFTVDLEGVYGRNERLQLE